MLWYPKISASQPTDTRFSTCRLPLKNNLRKWNTSSKNARERTFEYEQIGHLLCCVYLAFRFLEWAHTDYCLLISKFRQQNRIISYVAEPIPGVCRKVRTSMKTHSNHRNDLTRDNRESCYSQRIKKCVRSKCFKRTGTSLYSLRIFHPFVFRTLNVQL